MNRTLICLVLAVAFAAYRWQGSVPVPVVVPDAVPAGDLVAIARQMDRADRTAMADAYTILARSLAGDPESEPVFDTTAAVRAGHRAALLTVWKGVLGNKPGKYPGLREQLEGVLDKRIGLDDVPLNQGVRQEAVRAFQEIAAAFSR